jgi:hypothetical protein
MADPKSRRSWSRFVPVAALGGAGIVLGIVVGALIGHVGLWTIAGLGVGILAGTLFYVTGV